MKTPILTLLGLSVQLSLMATHNLGGYIQAEAIDPNDPTRYRLTLYTYTDPAPAGVDRCNAELLIYDLNTGELLQSIDDIPRSNGPVMVNLPSGDCSLATANNGQSFLGTIKWNQYQGEVQFPDTGHYAIMYNDQGYFQALANVPSAGDQEFAAMTTVRVLPAGSGVNSSPVFLNQPFNQEAISGQPWVHLPGGYEPDLNPIGGIQGEDSLHYKLISPLVFDPLAPFGPSNPAPMMGYQSPDDPTFGSSTLTMNPRSGLLTWDSPQQPGWYLIAYEVSAWRTVNGVLTEISSTTRNLSIRVAAAPANPSPTLQVLSSTCSGDTLRLRFSVKDADPSDSTYVMLNNGPFGENGPFSPKASTPGDLVAEVIDGQGGSTVIVNAESATISMSNTPGSSLDSVIYDLEWVSSPQEAGHYWPIEVFAYNPQAVSGTRFLRGTYWVIDETVCANANVAISTPTLSPWRVFPNPANGIIRISGPRRGPLQAAWYDVAGRFLYQETLTQGDTQVSVAGLTPGVYWLRLQDADYVPSWERVLIVR